MKYDGLGRRDYKEIINCADWDRTYNYYYDGHKLVETRNGSGKVLKQYVWGTQYIDELLQVGINEDPWGEGEENCDAFYYAAHDANYNVIGLFEDDGDLIERYEYTPYGQRTVYTSGGSNDVTCRSPIMESKRAVADELVIAPVLRPVLTASPGHVHA